MNVYVKWETDGFTLEEIEECLYYGYCDEI